MKLVYSPHYNITFFGIERVHPFDSRKYGRAWAVLKQEFGQGLMNHHVKVERPVTEQELLAAHTPEYLASLRSSTTLARALEIPLLKFLPAWLARWRV
ncbi:MAG TPA: histone deacetylase, partial [Candidatus Dormibacteraeota bacterium]|nr:histone deacetylase [Candidatus Dormibacteraeota bacterium]